MQYILHGSHCWSSFNTSNVGPTLNPSQSFLSFPEAALLEETRAKSLWECVGESLQRWSLILPAQGTQSYSLIDPQKVVGQASGNGTYWSNTTTSQCPVYWRASRRARSLASDLQQKRWALLRQLRAFLPGGLLPTGKPRGRWCPASSKKILGTSFISN